MMSPEEEADLEERFLQLENEQVCQSTRMIELEKEFKKEIARLENVISAWNKEEK